MPETNSENSALTEESFASRTNDVIHLYSSIIELSSGRLKQIKDHIYQKRNESIWKKILDLRIIGVFMIIIDFTFKVMQIINDLKILESTEFVTVFIIGTLLLILGTYFNIKEIQDDRKLIDKENETITNTITACSGLMQGNS